MELSLSVQVIDMFTGNLERKYDHIPSYEEADLLAQLAMSQKKDLNKLVVILPGWHRTMKGEELERATRLSIEYKL